MEVDGQSLHKERCGLHCILKYLLFGINLLVWVSVVFMYDFSRDRTRKRSLWARMGKGGGGGDSVHCQKKEILTVPDFCRAISVCIICTCMCIQWRGRGEGCYLPSVNPKRNTVAWFLSSHHCTIHMYEY